MFQNSVNIFNPSKTDLLIEKSKPLLSSEHNQCIQNYWRIFEEFLKKQNKTLDIQDGKSSKKIIDKRKSNSRKCLVSSAFKISFKSYQKKEWKFFFEFKKLRTRLPHFLWFDKKFQDRFHRRYNFEKLFQSPISIDNQKYIFFAQIPNLYEFMHFLLIYMNFLFDRLE